MCNVATSSFQTYFATSVYMHMILDAETVRQLLNLINTILTIHNFCVNLHLNIHAVDMVGKYASMWVTPLGGQVRIVWWVLTVDLVALNILHKQKAAFHWGKKAEMDPGNQGRDKWTPLKHMRICSSHFVTGKSLFWQLFIRTWPYDYLS